MRGTVSIGAVLVKQDGPVWPVIFMEKISIIMMRPLRCGLVWDGQPKGCCAGQRRARAWGYRVLRLDRRARMWDRKPVIVCF